VGVVGLVGHRRERAGRPDSIRSRLVSGNLAPWHARLVRCQRLRLASVGASHAARFSVRRCAVLNSANANPSVALPFTARRAMFMMISSRPPPQVLVVDDDADTREMLRLCLSLSGVDATEAANATDALKRVSETPPHAILLDMGLPDIDGYELCRRLRANPSTQLTPIIALTGYAFPTDIERARGAGCDAVLVKPCPTEHILLELQRHLPSLFRAVA
jgi:CheY-like chemotaxis protein